MNCHSSGKFVYLWVHQSRSRWGRVPPPHSKKFAKKRRKDGKRGERGENLEKEEKVRKKRKKSGRFFHFAPPDRYSLCIFMGCILYF